MHRHPVQAFSHSAPFFCHSPVPNPCWMTEYPEMTHLHAFPGWMPRWSKTRGAGAHGAITMEAESRSGAQQGTAKGLLQARANCPEESVTQPWAEACQAILPASQERCSSNTVQHSLCFSPSLASCPYQVPGIHTCAVARPSISKDPASLGLP